MKRRKDRKVCERSSWCFMSTPLWHFSPAALCGDYFTQKQEEITIYCTMYEFVSEKWVCIKQFNTSNGCCCFVIQHRMSSLANSFPFQHINISPCALRVLSISVFYEFVIYTMFGHHWETLWSLGNLAIKMLKIETNNFFFILENVFLVMLAWTAPVKRAWRFETELRLKK